jgi:hypothetical protein
MGMQSGIFILYSGENIGESDVNILSLLICFSSFMVLVPLGVPGVQRVVVILFSL